MIIRLFTRAVGQSGAGKINSVRLYLPAIKLYRAYLNYKLSKWKHWFVGYSPFSFVFLAYSERKSSYA